MHPDIKPIIYYDTAFDYTQTFYWCLRLTWFHVHDAMWIIHGNESVLQKQALVVMGTIVNECLLIARCTTDTTDFIAFCLFIKTRFDLVGKDDINPTMNMVQMENEYQHEIKSDSCWKCQRYLDIRAVVEEVQEGS